MPHQNSKNRHSRGQISKTVRCKSVESHQKCSTSRPSHPPTSGRSHMAFNALERALSAHYRAFQGPAKAWCYTPGHIGGVCERTTGNRCNEPLQTSTLVYIGTLLTRGGQVEVDTHVIPRRFHPTPTDTLTHTLGVTTQAAGGFNPNHAMGAL